MADSLDILNAAASLLVRAALLAARFPGRVRRWSFRRSAARKTAAKVRDILVLKDRVCRHYNWHETSGKLSWLPRQAGKA